MGYFFSLLMKCDCVLLSTKEQWNSSIAIEGKVHQKWQLQCLVGKIICQRFSLELFVSGKNVNCLLGGRGRRSKTIQPTHLTWPLWLCFLWNFLEITLRVLCLNWLLFPSVLLLMSPRSTTLFNKYRILFDYSSRYDYSMGYTQSNEVGKTIIIVSW